MRTSFQDLVNRTLHHDMIQKYTTLPAYPDMRMKALRYFLDEHCTEQQRVELYTVTSSLAQLGMDTHDQIDLHDEHLSEPEMRGRQLKVLAGDYFSSRFYQLLAKFNDIELIQALCGGICDSNRVKVTLHEASLKFAVTAESFWKASIEIKAVLYRTFASFFRESEVAHLWQRVIDAIAACEVVIEQREASQSASTFKGSYGYWSLLERAADALVKPLQAFDGTNSWPAIKQALEREQVVSELEQKLNESIAALQEATYSINQPKLRANVESIVSHYRSMQVALT